MMSQNAKNLNPVWVIVKREIRDQIRDWRIIIPFSALTLLFPFLMDFAANQVVGFVQRYQADIIAGRLIPFFMMIVGFFPISISLVIALESFVGEKERGSIEPLLNTPLKDWQLYMGKLISAIIPALMSGFLGMGIYASSQILHGLMIPDARLLLPIFGLTIVQTLVMVSGAVAVSSQATSVRAANLLAAFIVIPVALLIQVESLVMFWGNYRVLWLFVFGLAILSALLIRIGLSHFQREELLGREFDVLNIRWGWNLFWQTFLGEARNIKDWYLRVLPDTIRGLGRAIVFMILLLLLAGWLGSREVSPISADLIKNPIQIDASLRALITQWPIFSFPPVLAIWWQNVRAILISFILGVFTFGILGVLPQMVTFGLLGFIVGVINQSGMSAWGFLIGAILPHGLFEIPAVVLAGAAIMQMGAILATPTPGKTIGAVWIGTLAKWSQVMIGAVVPILFVAAAMEAWVTPHIALMLLN